MQRIIKNFLWIMTPLVVILFIFHNSMYSIIQSDHQSGLILTVLNRFLTANGCTLVFTQFAVRKLAHLIEYFMFGFILTVSIQMSQKKITGFLFFELFLFLAFPTLDESIQLFYPGRSSSVRDVLIDFVGCFMGMAICRLSIKMPKKAVKDLCASANKIDLTASIKFRSKRQVLTVITVLFTIFILHNSIFDGIQSSSQSLYMTTLLNHVLSLFPLPVLLSEHFVRKLAHFAEYLVLGVLLLETIGLYQKQIRKSAFAGMFFLLLVPVIDEFIQTFQPGRSGSVIDILLDFSGGISGMLLCFLIRLLRQRTKTMQQ